jgi:hypothetical protein
MKNKIKEIINLSEKTRVDLEKNHEGLNLLRSFNNVPKKIKNICFAAILATSVTGCSSMSSGPLISNGLAFKEVGAVSAMEGLNGMELYKKMALSESEDLIDFENKRDYYLDDLDVPVYTVDEATQKFKSGELFSENEIFNIKNPYDNNKLVKVADVRNEFNFNGFGKDYSPPMFMYNPNLISSSASGIKKELRMGINLDELDPKKIKSSEFKTMIFHELNHGNLSQEIIVHSHHKSFPLSEIALQTKILLGMDLSEDGTFYTRKLLESHSDISSAITMKIHEKMSDSEFDIFLRDIISRQAFFEMKGNENDEHQSLMSYQKLHDLFRKDPNSFDNMSIEEVPYFSMSFVFDAGFKMGSGLNALKNYLEERGEYSEGVFIGSLNRDNLALRALVQTLGYENDSAKELFGVLEKAKDYKDLRFVEHSLGESLNNYKESGVVKNYLLEGNEGLSYVEILEDKLKSVRQEIVENGYDKLHERSNDLFNKLSDEWKVKSLPDSYKNSPFLSMK